MQIMFYKIWFKMGIGRLAIATSPLDPFRKQFIST